MAMCHLVGSCNYQFGLRNYNSTTFYKVTEDASTQFIGTRPGQCWPVVLMTRRYSAYHGHPFLCALHCLG